MKRDFLLKPFPSQGILPEVQITGAVGRRSGKLSICYALLGPLAEIAIPAPAEMPVRKDALWVETCFEFFLGPRTSDRYWEFNLSPAGHWNVYRFTSYRQGMEEESAYVSLPFDVRLHSDSLLLSLELDLDLLIPAAEALEAGISAVIKTMNGTTYWALTHPGPQADFHRRDSFIVEL